MVSIEKNGLEPLLHRPSTLLRATCLSTRDDGGAGCVEDEPSASGLGFLLRDVGFFQSHLGCKGRQGWLEGLVGGVLSSAGGRVVKGGEGRCWLGVGGHMIEEGG